MAAKYTNSPIAKANLTAILAIPRSELPDSASGIYPILYASDSGIAYKFDPDATTNGLLPTGASGAGLWLPLHPNVGWEFVDSNFNAKAGGSYLNFSGSTIIATFPPANQLVKGQTIRLFNSQGVLKINSNSVFINPPFATSSTSVSPSLNPYGVQQYFQVTNINTLAEYVYGDNSWIATTANFSVVAEPSGGGI